MTQNAPQLIVRLVTYKSYAVGYILCLLLTLAAYFVVEKQLLSGWMLISAVVFLGLIQISVQLILFLHLGIESKPRWNLITFFFMALVTAIIVIGSLWIMANLDYRMSIYQT
jgi:cytochrome o ubiquinol oxidase operon protein cyoD